MEQSSTKSEWKSPLYQMTQTTPTSLWNDSASTSELAYAIDNGAVGATCNPVIVLTVVRQEMSRWMPRLAELIEEGPTATEDEIGWRLVEEISRSAARLLEPIFEQAKGRNGRLSIQTDPRYYRDTEAILRQATRFNELADNMIVKIPATAAGIPAIEAATYAGITINATVSFTVPQAVLVAEAVERGLRRREAEGKSILHMGPVCTIMVGRLDDWLKVVADKQGILTDPGHLEWAGVAAFKKAYEIYSERGLPDTAAFCGVPQPLPLERAHRRRRRHFSAACVASADQCQRHPGRAAHQPPGRPGNSLRPAEAFPRLREGLRRRRPIHNRAGRLWAHLSAPCGSSSAPAPTSPAWCETS